MVTESGKATLLDPSMLSLQVLSTYQRAISGQELEADAEGLVDLIRLGLLVPHPVFTGHYSPTEPGRAERQFLTAAYAQLAAVSGFLSNAPAFLDQLQDAYRGIRPLSSAGASEHLVGADIIDSRIAEEHRAARWEVLAAQPGPPRPATVLDRSLDRDTAALDRGVTMRGLYHAAVRSAQLTSERAQLTAAKGGEIRTLEMPFPKCIIFDRHTAFIPNHTSGEEPLTPEAYLVRDPFTVAWIAEVFEHYWERADQWLGGKGCDGDIKTIPIQRSILRDLCNGLSQTQAGTRHGITQRTVNKHLAALRDDLGMTTLTEVIFWWATSPDRRLD
jgi:DNA-binding CsgD family transcriptional regulator